jgi:hypothetical protein
MTPETIDWLSLLATATTLEESVTIQFQQFLWAVFRS